MNVKALPLIMAGVMAFFLTACGSKTTFTDQSPINIGDNKMAKADSPDSGQTISNKYFEITIPGSVAGIIDTDVSDDRIDIFDKESRDAGFGGLVVSIWAVAVPREFAGGPYTKIGELSNSEADSYDIVRGEATEVQWDYLLDNMPANFKKIHNSVDSILASITGINGYSYFEGAGTKGADLYNNILAKYVIAVNEGWDANKYEAENMSPEFFAETENTEGNKLDAIGYAYQDINCDGIDELFVGTFGIGAFEGVVYDVYTMIDHSPVHVVTGTSRNRYYDYDNGFICNEWSGGADSSGYDLYALMENDTEMVFQYGYKYDASADEKNPWFKTYDGQNYEKITEEEFNDAYAMENSFVRFKYTPLSSNQDAIALAEYDSSK